MHLSVVNLPFHTLMLLSLCSHSFWLFKVIKLFCIIQYLFCIPLWGFFFKFWSFMHTLVVKFLLFICFGHFACLWSYSISSWSLYMS